MPKIMVDNQQPQAEKKLDFISGADFPRHGPNGAPAGETAEEAYRRGYRHGFMDAAYKLPLGLKLFRRLEAFIYGPLLAWVRRANKKYVRGLDGKLHYDCHSEPPSRMEFPPSFDDESK
jgi:hypothetical protein